VRLKRNVHPGWQFVSNCLVGLLFIGLLVTDVEGGVYYVDSAGGSDTNSGTASISAWKTLTKVNGTTFRPKDSILFKAGESWMGTLSPLGSGDEGNPITISSYGTNQAMPLINGNGNTDALILTNQQYWEINGLEVINPASTDAERRGIHLCAANFGTVNHLYVSNCYIHNIHGKVDVSNGDQSAKRSGGIEVEVIADALTPTRFNDVIIQNCTISSVTNQGVVACGNRGGSDYPGTAAWNARHCSNLIIRNNVINDVCKNAMSIRYCDNTCLVEHNVVFDTAITTSGNQIVAYGCRGTIFQYNEGYRNHGGDSARDGSLYDSDLRTVQTVWQYSYSHDNSWGLFVQYASASDVSDRRDTGDVVRYNISRNDKGDIFALTGDRGALSSEYIYNNTIYASAGLSPTFIDDRTGGHASYFYNNIFYNLSSTAKYNLTSLNENHFDYNTFFGQHPAGEPSDAHKLTTDPKLSAPGTGTDGLDSMSGYKLQFGSPCIDSGLTITAEITGNSNAGSLDYWGNQVPYNGATDRGAHEWSGTPTIASAQSTPGVIGRSMVLSPATYYSQFGSTTNTDNLIPTPERVDK
jgi:hypothetical protein